MGELIARFLVVGAVAFGGGQAALPVLERLTVADTGWLTPRQFATGIGLAYATPGPVLILAAFVGMYVAGPAGALAATVAVFTVPVVAAGASAQLVQLLETSDVFQAFGRYAGAAAIGLLGVTLASLIAPLWDISPALLAGSGIVLLAALRGIHPLVLLVVGGLVGALIGALLP